MSKLINNNNINDPNTLFHPLFETVSGIFTMVNNFQCSLPNEGGGYVPSNVSLVRLINQSLAPINIDGAKMYTDFIDTQINGGHRYQPCRMTDSVISQVRQLHLRLFEATIRTTMEIIL